MVHGSPRAGSCHHYLELAVWTFCLFCPVHFLNLPSVNSLVNLFRFFPSLNPEARLCRPWHQTGRAPSPLNGHICRRFFDGKWEVNRSQSIWPGGSRAHTEARRRPSLAPGLSM